MSYLRAVQQRLRGWLLWYGARAPSLRVLGLHWVIPLALALHGLAIFVGTVVTVRLDSVPNIDALGTVFLGICALPVFYWIHTQWRDRSALPIGVTAGLAWTPIVALALVTALASPAVTVSWVIGERVRALDNDPHRFAEAAGLCRSYTSSSAKELFRPSENISMAFANKAGIDWQSLEVFSSSGNVRGIVDPDYPASSDGRSASDARGRMTANICDFVTAAAGPFYREHRVLSPDGWPVTPFSFESRWELSNLLMSCIALAHLACLGAVLPRTTILRQGSLFFFCASVPFLSRAHIERVQGERAWLPAVIIGMTSLGPAAIIAGAIVRRQRSNLSDFATLLLSCGFPVILAYLGWWSDLHLFGAFNWLVGVEWSLLLTLFIMFGGSRYREASSPRLASPLTLSLQRWTGTHRLLHGLPRSHPALAQALPVPALAVALAGILMCLVLLRYSPVDPRDVPDPWLAPLC